MKIVKPGADGNLVAYDANGQLKRPTILPKAADLATLIQRFQNQAAAIMDKLEEDDELSIEKKANTLKTLAGILPMLEQAELARETRVGKKNVKDLTSAELKKLASGILKGQDLIGAGETDEELTDE